MREGDGDQGPVTDVYGPAHVVTDVIATLSSDEDSGPSQENREDKEVNNAIKDVGPVIRPYSGEIYALIRARGS
jgi:hypothetical protein